MFYKIHRFFNFSSHFSIFFRIICVFLQFNNVFQQSSCFHPDIFQNKQVLRWFITEICRKTQKKMEIRELKFPTPISQKSICHFVSNCKKKNACYIIHACFSRISLRENKTWLLLKNRHYANFWK